MLTPADKIATRANDIIQVVVTNKCDLFNCSNCTQLLPLRKDVREMSLDCAEEALQSLQGWPGVIAMFGGNPCTHSQFEALCFLWNKYVPAPQRGLWTNNLLTKGEVAATTFIDGVSRFNFNVHGSSKAAEEMRKWFPKTRVFGERPSDHGSVLGYYKDYGVSDEDWISARENCDINQKWSAGIYAREVEIEDRMTGDLYGPIQKPFVYFCEVAGAIDGVTGENNGILATEGWWKKPIGEFQRQIDRCCDRNCVVPLRYKGSVDQDDTYDVSKSVIPLTTNRIGKIKVVSHDTPQPKTHELTDYQGFRK